MVDVDSCAVRYGERLVFSNASLRAAEGEKIAILGRSGTGKTSLLSLVAGIIPPEGGAVLVDGKPPVLGSPAVSLLPQGADLFPWMDARANVEIALAGPVRKKRERSERALAMLARMGLSSRSAAYPRELSGGERQRVALARAFVREPGLILMDEPFSALDAITREEMQDLFLELASSRPVTALIVTHSIEEALVLGDSVYILSTERGLARSRSAGLGSASEGAGDFRASREFAEAARSLRMEFDEE
jgi:ABC-type nitrate/sulfonate/bicarbonate transport system ATPase subunit